MVLVCRVCISNIGPDKEPAEPLSKYNDFGWNLLTGQILACLPNLNLGIIVRNPLVVCAECASIIRTFCALRVRVEETEKILLNFLDFQRQCRLDPQDCNSKFARGRGVDLIAVASMVDSVINSERIPVQVDRFSKSDETGKITVSARISSDAKTLMKHPDNNNPNNSSKIDIDNSRTANNNSIGNISSIIDVDEEWSHMPYLLSLNEQFESNNLTISPNEHRTPTIEVTRVLRSEKPGPKFTKRKINVSTPLIKTASVVNNPKCDNSKRKAAETQVETEIASKEIVTINLIKEESIEIPTNDNECIPKECLDVSFTPLKDSDSKEVQSIDNKLKKSPELLEISEELPYKPQKIRCRLKQSRRNRCIFNRSRRRIKRNNSRSMPLLTTVRHVPLKSLQDISESQLCQNTPSFQDNELSSSKETALLETNYLATESIITPAKVFSETLAERRKSLRVKKKPFPFSMKANCVNPRQSDNESMVSTEVIGPIVSTSISINDLPASEQTSSNIRADKEPSLEIPTKSPHTKSVLSRYGRRIKTTETYSKFAKKRRLLIRTRSSAKRTNSPDAMSLPVKISFDGQKTFLEGLKLKLVSPKRVTKLTTSSVDEAITEDDTKVSDIKMDPDVPSYEKDPSITDVYKSADISQIIDTKLSLSEMNDEILTIELKEPNLCSNPPERTEYTIPTSNTIKSVAEGTKTRKFKSNFGTPLNPETESVHNEIAQIAEATSSVVPEIVASNIIPTSPIKEGSCRTRRCRTKPASDVIKNVAITNATAVIPKVSVDIINQVINAVNLESENAKSKPVVLNKNTSISKADRVNKEIVIENSSSSRLSRSRSRKDVRKTNASLDITENVSITEIAEIIGVVPTPTIDQKVYENNSTKTALPTSSDNKDSLLTAVEVPVLPIEDLTNEADTKFKNAKSKSVLSTDAPTSSIPAQISKEVACEDIRSRTRSSRSKSKSKKDLLKSTTSLDNIQDVPITEAISTIVEMPDLTIQELINENNTKLKTDTSTLDDNTESLAKIIASIEVSAPIKEEFFNEVNEISRNTRSKSLVSINANKETAIINAPDHSIPSQIIKEVVNEENSRSSSGRFKSRKGLPISVATDGPPITEIAANITALSITQAVDANKSEPETAIPILKDNNDSQLTSIVEVPTLNIKEVVNEDSTTRSKSRRSKRCIRKSVAHIDNNKDVAITKITTTFSEVQNIEEAVSSGTQAADENVPIFRPDNNADTSITEVPAFEELISEVKSSIDRLKSDISLCVNDVPASAEGTLITKDLDDENLRSLDINNDAHLSEVTTSNTEGSVLFLKQEDNKEQIGRRKSKSLAPLDIVKDVRQNAPNISIEKNPFITQIINEEDSKTKADLPKSDYSKDSLLTETIDEQVNENKFSRPKSKPAVFKNIKNVPLSAEITSVIEVLALPDEQVVDPKTASLSINKEVSSIGEKPCISEGSATNNESGVKENITKSRRGRPKSKASLEVKADAPLIKASTSINEIPFHPSNERVVQYASAKNKRDRSKSVLSSDLHRDPELSAESTSNTKSSVQESLVNIENIATSFDVKSTTDVVIAEVPDQITEQVVNKDSLKHRKRRTRSKICLKNLIKNLQLKPESTEIQTSASEQVDEDKSKFKATTVPKVSTQNSKREVDESNSKTKRGRLKSLDSLGIGENISETEEYIPSAEFPVTTNDQAITVNILHSKSGHLNADASLEVKKDVPLTAASTSIVNLPGPINNQVDNEDIPKTTKDLSKSIPFLDVIEDLALSSAEKTSISNIPALRNENVISEDASTFEEEIEGNSRFLDINRDLLLTETTATIRNVPSYKEETKVKRIKRSKLDVSLDVNKDASITATSCLIDEEIRNGGSKMINDHIPETVSKFKVQVSPDLFEKSKIVVSVDSNKDSPLTTSTIDLPATNESYMISSTHEHIVQDAQTTNVVAELNTPFVFKESPNVEATSTIEHTLVPVISDTIQPNVDAKLDNVEQTAETSIIETSDLNGTLLGKPKFASKDISPSLLSTAQIKLNEEPVTNKDITEIVADLNFALKSDIQLPPQKMDDGSNLKKSELRNEIVIVISAVDQSLARVKLKTEPLETTISKSDNLVEFIQPKEDLIDCKSSASDQYDKSKEDVNENLISQLNEFQNDLSDSVRNVCIEELTSLHQGIDGITKLPPMLQNSEPVPVYCSSIFLEDISNDGCELDLKQDDTQQYTVASPKIISISDIDKNEIAVVPNALFTIDGNDMSTNTPVDVSQVAVQSNNVIQELMNSCQNVEVFPNLCLQEPVVMSGINELKTNKELPNEGNNDECSVRLIQGDSNEKSATASPFLEISNDLCQGAFFNEIAIPEAKSDPIIRCTNKLVDVLNNMTETNDTKHMDATQIQESLTVATIKEVTSSGDKVIVERLVDHLIISDDSKQNLVKFDTDIKPTEGIQDVIAGVMSSILEESSNINVQMMPVALSTIDSLKQETSNVVPEILTDNLVVTNHDVSNYVISCLVQESTDSKSGQITGSQYRLNDNVDIVELEEINPLIFEDPVMPTAYLNVSKEKQKFLPKRSSKRKHKDVGTPANCTNKTEEFDLPQAKVRKTMHRSNDTNSLKHPTTPKQPKKRSNKSTNISPFIGTPQDLTQCTSTLSNPNGISAGDCLLQSVGKSPIETSCLPTGVISTSDATSAITQTLKEFWAEFNTSLESPGKSSQEQFIDSMCLPEVWSEVTLPYLDDAEQDLCVDGSNLEDITPTLMDERKMISDLEYIGSTAEAYLTVQDNSNHQIMLSAPTQFDIVDNVSYQQIHGLCLDDIVHDKITSQTLEFTSQDNASIDYGAAVLTDTHTYNTRTGYLPEVDQNLNEDSALPKPIPVLVSISGKSGRQSIKIMKVANSIEDSNMENCEIISQTNSPIFTEDVPIEISKVPERKSSLFQLQNTSFSPNSTSMQLVKPGDVLESPRNCLHKQRGSYDNKTQNVLLPNPPKFLLSPESKRDDTNSSYQFPTSIPLSALQEVEPLYTNTNASNIQPNLEMATTTKAIKKAIRKRSPNDGEIRIPTPNSPILTGWLKHINQSHVNQNKIASQSSMNQEHQRDNTLSKCSIQPESSLSTDSTNFVSSKIVKEEPAKTFLTEFSKYLLKDSAMKQCMNVPSPTAKIVPSKPKPLQSFTSVILPPSSFVPLSSQTRGTEISKKKYTCDICRFDFALELSLTKHNEWHRKWKGLYECQYCVERFDCLEQMQSHTTTHGALSQSKDCNRRLRGPNRLCEYSHSKRNSSSNVSFLPEAEVLCPDCGRLVTTSILPFHLDWHDPEAPVQCSICTRFVLRMNRQMHWNEHHHYSKQFVCAVCGECYSTKQTLCWHLEKHSNKCRLCGDDVSGINFDEHICSPSNQRPYKRRKYQKMMATYRNKKVFKCKSCSMAFYSRDLLRIHSYRMHKECDQCGQVCFSEIVLQAHKIKVHGIDINAQFALCTRNYKSNTEILEEAEREMRRVLKQSRPGAKSSRTTKRIKKISCDICGHICQTYASLSNHRRYHRTPNSHHRGKQQPKEDFDYDAAIEGFICRVCRAIFPTMSSRTAHMRIHSIKLTIDVPPKQSPAKTRRSPVKSSNSNYTKQLAPTILFPKVLQEKLSSPLLTTNEFSSDDSDTSMFSGDPGGTVIQGQDMAVMGHVCKICDKKFRSLKQLSLHINVHSGIKNFDCRQCDKHFFTKGGLQEHEFRFHSPIKPDSLLAQNQAKEHLVEPSLYTAASQSPRRTHACHCGEQFLSLATLRKHKVLKHPKNDDHHSTYDQLIDVQSFNMGDYR